MTWWELTVLVLGCIVIIAGGAMAALTSLWRWQEKRDGLR